MGGCQGHHGNLPCLGLLCDAHGHGGMGIDEVARTLKNLRHRFKCLLLIGCACAEQIGDSAMHVSGQGVAALGLQIGHQITHHLRIASGGFEQKALKIGRDLNVHGGGDRHFDIRQSVGTRGQRAAEDIVFVRRNHKAVNPQTHLLGHEARKDVAKISRWHGKGDVAVGRLRSRHRQRP